MKKGAFAIFIFFLCARTVVSAQCTNVLDAYTNTTTFQIVTYNNDDAMVSTTNFTVDEIRKEPERILVLMHYVTTNKKGKETAKGNRSIIISGNNYLINLSTIIPEYTSDDPQYASYSCTPKNNEDFPKWSKVTTYTIDNMGQKSIMTNKMGMEEGKYGGNETITTPLGTFDCIKLTYKLRYDLQDFTYTEWIDASGRTIKTERLNKKGELDTYSILTSFTK